MNDKLLLDKEAMQALGYRVVDMIVNHITELDYYKSRLCSCVETRAYPINKSSYCLKVKKFKINFYFDISSICSFKTCLVIMPITRANFRYFMS